MKRTSIFLAAMLLAVCTMAPAFAQAPAAPRARWKSQTDASGARVFTPVDLAAGEVYNVSLYEPAPLNGKTLEEWLRAFAGPVGKKPGQLAAPLQIKAAEEGSVTGSSTWSGPNGTTLSVTFRAVSLDNATVHVLRTLSSGQNGLSRYQDGASVYAQVMVGRARIEAGDNIVRAPSAGSGVLPAVTKVMKPGGKLVPGIYAGGYAAGGKALPQVHLHLYANGQYRITDANDKDLSDRRGNRIGIGQYGYNPDSGKLEFGKTSSKPDPKDEISYHGRDAANKPVVHTQEPALNREITLRYAGPPTKRLPPSVEEARNAAIAAEKRRYKWVTAPGKGVKHAQIQAVVHYFKEDLYGAGIGGLGVKTTNEAFLLLKDKTIRVGLPCPIDQLDVARSRKNEPEVWGRWKIVNNRYQVSRGGPYVALPGNEVWPGKPQTRLQGRYGTGSSNGVSWALWGVTFDKGGRFRKDGRGGASNSSFTLVPL